ncbi:MAG: hypothetical protein E6K23_02860 [Gammaproteobacteria bacterium]|nr:MAG: hypothetical protein E6K47_12145 [Gammaproteobacteria bacterium]TLY95273.1 MAG: hypothetical protein E6K40_05505 [Gammaproteobacteria bacterium]TLZ05831.1 MAG: hypothetical protein E6K36_01180 [Gammaproteobacteria bacterium]TLZ21087.1 MAG: hypothetical protein E6K34_05975 [Gammaproteobacteria bacterium]TLZ42618.1 MAG: hypothetical protein E6K23_02860 [Gammaproteobacteria bacterium]
MPSPGATSVRCAP